MKILARSNRVLWINSIGLRRPDASLQDASRIVHKLRKFCQGPIEVQKNLHVLTPIAIPFHDLPYVPSVNAWLLSRYVRAQAKKTRDGIFSDVDVSSYYGAAGQTPEG